ncbi:MAG: hypothetical protein KA105_09515 [Caulobacter sp.]|jgi:hypothetical protein|nr:hypothetical protein [Caulobacter sp.]
MEDLFKGYWWLLFPLAWFIMAGWQSFLNYRKHKDTLELIKSYVASGKDVPPGLLERLNAPAPEDDWSGVDDRAERRAARRYRRNYGLGGWSRVVLFGSLAAGFGYAAATDMYEAGPGFIIVTFVMGALTLASLVATLTSRPRG